MMELRYLAGGKCVLDASLFIKTNEYRETNITFLDIIHRLVLQGNGPIRQVETCPDFYFFTARVHTTKSTIKILAANTHCKYFLKISEITRFSVRGTACARGLYNPS
jgi:hypothetical protein